MTRTKILLLVLLAVVAVSCNPKVNKEEDKNDFIALFNGTDLSGWETYIGVPEPSVNLPDLPKDDDGNYTEPIGLNKDPLNIFSVVQVDGEPAIHVSGEVYGALATVKEFENYHFRMEVKWGDQKWPPREEKLRNSGLLYHGTGDYGVGLGVWKKSHECQVMETMFGDSYRMGDTYCSIRASIPEGEERIKYNPEAEEVGFGEDEPGGKICAKSVTNEKPVGEWNTVEIICFKDKSIHIINGLVNMVNTNSHLMVNGEIIPLTKGNIQLQSEGAEVYFRKIMIKEISAIPAEYLN